MSRVATISATTVKNQILANMRLASSGQLLCVSSSAPSYSAWAEDRAESPRPPEAHAAKDSPSSAKDSPRSNSEDEEVGVQEAGAASFKTKSMGRE